MNATGDRGPTRAEHRIDVIATVLLAVATLATAWAGYQSSRWHSVQAEDQQTANASRIESTRSADVANREAQVDISLFMQWVDARATGDERLAEFWRGRFTDRLEPAFEAWIALDPLKDPDAPSSPFVMKRYQIPSMQDSEAQEATADAAGADAREAIERADRYVFAVVLFAACLFFAGLSTRLRTENGQVVVLGLGCVLFIATAVWVATFPVTITL